MKFNRMLLAASSAAVVALGAQSASAHVVCNRYGDCWSTHANLHYPRALRVRIYNDRYADERYRERRWRAYHRMWRDENHDRDRGYYRNGVWITF